MNEVLEKELFWEKYRPHNFDDVITPPRIKKLIEKGINGNYLFHGTSGMGKTTISRILMKEYPDGQHILLNGKLGVDDLRNKVKSFCSEMIAFVVPNKLRVVYFEEFDRASKQLQEELKSFMEDEYYSHKVRFLATSNNINRIDPAIRSRFTEVDFTPRTEETKELKTEYYKRVSKINDDDNLNLDKEDLKQIVINRFPDFRKIWQDVQYLYLTGVNSSVMDTKDSDNKLFELALNPVSTVATWEYLYKNWSDKIDTAFVKLGKDFFKYVTEKYPNKTNILGKTIILVSEYSDIRMANSIDPFITLTALIYELQQLN